MKTTAMTWTARLAVVAFAAAPAFAQGRSDRNQVVAVHYGQVIGIERVQLESRAASGAVVGGLAGLAIRGGGRTTRSVARGAAAGGVGTRLLEGSNQANEYHVRLLSGQEVRMVLDETTGIRLGDCVSVEQGRRANLRRVSGVHCDGGASEVTEAHRAEATACDQAMQALADATDEAAIELHIQRVRILCED
jgi:outer membrane lipoprotein SlyB